MAGELSATRAKELYDAGDLRGAVEAVTAEVKAAPSDAARRTFLFELLCFAGEWERAARQLDVLGHQSAGAEAGVQVYHNCIRAELDRQKLVAHGLQPHFLAEPPPYVDLHLAALNHLRAGNPRAAREALDRAEEERPAFPCVVNGARADDFRDYNDFFAPVLELIVHDKYTWVPLEHVTRFEVEPPAQLRDLVWAVAQVESAGNELRAHLPALYVNSGRHPNDLVRLGRMTDWQEAGDELYTAAGLRLFAAGGEEQSVHHVRAVAFERRGEGETAPA